MTLYSIWSCVTIHLLTQNSVMIPHSICRLFRLAGYVIGWHDRSINLPTYFFRQQINRESESPGNEWTYETAQLRKWKKYSSTNKQRTEHGFVIIIFSLKNFFKKGTCIHPSPKLLVIDRDLIHDLNVSQFLGIQSQAQGSSHYRISFRLFSFRFL